MTAPDAYPPDLARGAAGERAAFLTDAAGRVHRAVLLAFAAGGERPSRRTLIHAAGDAAAADRALHELHDRDVIRLDGAGAIRAAYPFSGVPTPHRVEFAGGPTVYAMCAIDALGMSAMLGRGVTIQSSASRIDLPAYGHLTTLLFGSQRGAHRVQALGAIVWIAVVAMFGGSTVVALALLPTVLDMMAVSALYVVALGLLMWISYTTTINARPFFVSLYERYPLVIDDELHRLLPRRPIAGTDTARGISYLLLPRKDDLAKAAVFIIPWILGTVVFGLSRGYGLAEYLRSFWLGVFVIVAFELLVYQARYQWNDLRGANQDPRHPAARDRRRLPAGWERASLAVLVVRLLAAAYVANVFFRHSDDANLMYAILTVPFLIALPYEYARAKSDQEPAAFDRRPGRWQIGVYALIGLGYGTRATLGVLVAALLGADPVLLLLIFLAAALAASADTVRYWAKESAVENALEQETGETTVRAHVAPLHRYIADRSTGLSGLGR